MRNYFAEGYQKIDDFLMGGANMMLHTWNWATGGTKIGLARFLTASGAGVNLYGTLTDEQYSTKGKVYSSSVPVAMGASGLSSISFYEKIDNQYPGQDVKSLPLEELKERLALIGPLSIMLTIPWLIPPLKAKEPMAMSLWQDNVDKAIIRALGWLVMSSSYYVLRCGDLPPRKNVLNRTKDGLVGLIVGFNKEVIPARIS